MKQKNWILVILLGALVINAGVYLVVRGRRAPALVEPAPSASPSEPVAPVARAEPAVPPPAPQAEDANEGLSRARRAAGLAALEDRDYDKAVSEFTEALSLRKDKGDLVELLRIAGDLKSREQARKRPEPAKPQPEPTPARHTSRAKQVRLASARAPAREEPPAPDTPRNGLLLVTSTPPGLVVLVDGKTMDLTPARLQVRAGTHRVALAQGERKLFEDTVEVEEDAVQSINRDLMAELAPAPAPMRPAPEPVAVAPASAASPASTPPSPVAARVPPPTPLPTPPAASGSAAGGKGTLEISSPSIYGEVWVNNRPYGFPPVTATDLPAGQARVEVRVNGQVKRRMMVNVQPGRSSAIRVR